MVVITLSPSMGHRRRLSVEGRAEVHRQKDRLSDGTQPARRPLRNRPEWPTAHGASRDPCFTVGRHRAGIHERANLIIGIPDPTARPPPGLLRRRTPPP